jgi:hypothetical protein
VQLIGRVNGLLTSAAKIHSIGKIVQGPMREQLGQFGRLVAISCAKSTQPFGTGEKARTDARNRVAADIYKVYTTPGKAYRDIANEKAAKAFWWALQNGHLDKAIGILRRDGQLLRNVPLERFDGGSLHMQKRHSVTGRIAAKQQPLMIVRNPRQLEAYIKKRQANVGFAKSAWSDIARQLGSIRGLRESGDITANWITRNGGKGTIQWIGTNQAPVLRLTSTVSYGGRVLPVNVRNIAVQIARNRLAKSLQAAVRAETRKLRNAA